MIIALCRRLQRGKQRIWYHPLGDRGLFTARAGVSAPQIAVLARKQIGYAAPAVTAIIINARINKMRTEKGKTIEETV